jgi:hypothetical protein
MLGQMVGVAAECIKRPGRTSVWSKNHGKYVCSRDPEYGQALQQQTADITRSHPPIDPTFKLVFTTALCGTVLFFVTCVLIHLWTGGQMPEPMERLVGGMLDMVKIGFGAIVGLLGAKSLKASPDAK